MYCIKRALFSLKNRWKAYALLLAGCFALAAALCISLGVEENTKNVSDEMAAYYGGRIALYCPEKMELNGGEEKEALWLPQSDVDRIRGVEGVRDVACMKYFPACADDFEAFEQTEMEKKYMVLFSGELDYEENVMLMGEEDPASNSYFTSQEYALEEGNLETGGEKAVVSSLLAEKNGWEIGSRFTVSDAASGRKCEFTVAGTFSCADDTTTLYYYYQPKNQIFVSTKTVQELAGDGMYHRAMVVTESPEDVERIMEEIRGLGLESQDMLEMTDLSIEYLTAAEPLQSIRTLMRVIAISVLLFGAVVLVVYVHNILSSRLHEIGVLFAIGEKKRFILGQLAAEMLLVLLAAYILAMVLGGVLMPLFGTALLPSLGQFVEVAFALTWKVRLMVLGLFLLVELVLILVPLWLMAKNKPKEILTRGTE